MDPGSPDFSRAGKSGVTGKGVIPDALFFFLSSRARDEVPRPGIQRSRIKCGVTKKEMSSRATYFFIVIPDGYEVSDPGST